MYANVQTHGFCFPESRVGLMLKISPDKGHISSKFVCASLCVCLCVCVHGGGGGCVKHCSNEENKGKIK